MIAEVTRRDAQLLLLDGELEAVTDTPGCCGELLGAYSVTLLDLLERFVAARHRERSSSATSPA